MTRIEIEREALRLSMEERLELAEAIWNSVGMEPPLPLQDWQRQILDDRIAADDAAPEAGSPWPEVKRRILAAL
jgi:putative addiction module component (TIGR02574 family)